MEPVRPHDVALCSLLRSYLCPLEDDPPADSPLHAAFGEALLREVRRCDAATAPTLIDLLRSIQDRLCPSGDELSPEADYFGAVKLALGSRLSALETPDDLVMFFAALSEGVITSATSAPAPGDDAGADASSAIGLYLRMAYARYTAMPFEAICQLLLEVRDYFEAAVAALEGAPAPEGAAPPALRAAPDLDRFLNAQLAGAGARAGRAPQAQLEAPLAELEAAVPGLAKTHLARHLTSLHHRDYGAALDHLHRYFDRAVVGEQQGLFPAPPAAAAAEDAVARERGRLQSAALSLGSMHARLGHVEEAMQALNETVRIAQQSSDDVCLAHALASLCQILDATTPGTITSVSQAPGASPAARHYCQLGQLLRRCLKRSEELQLPHLVAFARLALARFELLHPSQPAAAPDGGSGGSGGSGGGSSEPPCASSLAVAGALQDTAHLHLATRLAAAAPVAPPASSGSTSARVLRGVADLFHSPASLFAPRLQGMAPACAAEVERLAGGAHLLQAAAWELRGSRQLSQAHALACLSTYGEAASAEDQCCALAQLAVSLAASHGYAAAEQLLAAADERFPAAQSRQLAGARLAVAHDRALARRDLHAAFDLAAQLAALASPTDATDIALRLEAEERLARTLAAAGRTEEAAAAVQRLLAMAASSGQPLHSARLLALLGRIHREAGAPLAALPYALAAAGHARQLAADLLAAEAAVLVAQLRLDLGREHAAQAAAELEGALPLVLAQGGLELQARAQGALAEALMARHASTQGLAQDAEWVLGLLDEAERLHQALEDGAGAAHARYLRALVHDALGQAQQRDADAAAHLASALQLSSVE